MYINPMSKQLPVLSKVFTAQPVPAKAIAEERERYDALMERLGPPDRRAVAAFLAQRDDTPPEDADDAELIARFRARFQSGQS